MARSSSHSWKSAAVVLATTLLALAILGGIWTVWRTVHINSSPTRIDPYQVKDEIVAVPQNKVWRLDDAELGRLMFRAEVRGDANAAYRVWQHLTLFGEGPQTKDHDKWVRLAAQLGHEDAALYLKQQGQKEVAAESNE